MRIAIIGAGAMGGFYGAMLARAGYDVHFLLRRDYQAVRKNGLTVKSCKGDFHLARINYYCSVEDIGPVDLVFIGLKTTANDAFCSLLPPLMGADTLFLTAQNGLGNEESLADLFGPERVAGGLAFLCSNRLEPGVIQHQDYGFLHIGNFKRKPDDKLITFGKMLNTSGVECHVVDDLALARWKKLVWNVPFNGLSTLLDMTVDKIIADDRLKQRSWRLMREVQQAAGAHNLVIEDGFLQHMMDLTVKMTPYYTSMHLDRRQGRPMEVESIIGEPLRRGQAKGLDLPEMASLYRHLAAMNQERMK